MVSAVRRFTAPENRQWLIAGIVACAFFMEMLDGSVIATALPQMARSFNENPVNLSIGMSAYLLTLAIFIPASGWFADRFGSKTIFLSAIVVFTAASVLCGFSNSLLEFTASRVVQGIGGAMMVPVGRAVVLRSSDKTNLVNLMQFITVPGLIAPVLGPPVGGFITTFTTWRWIFFLNIPIGLIGIALGAAYMINHKAAERRSFDTLGFILSGTGLAALLFGLDQLGRPAIDPALTVGLIGGGAVVLVLAWLHLRRAVHPLIDLSLFGIPTFALTTLFAGTGFRIVIGTTPFLWPLMFQVGFGMSAFASGALIISCAAGDLGMKLYARQILRRFGFRNTLIYNGLFVGLSVLACAAFGASTPIVAIAVVLFVVGLFRSVQFGSFNALTFVDVPPEKMSAASSLASTIQQMAFGLGVAFGALALHLAALLNGTSASQTYTVADFRLAFVAAAALAIASALAFSRLDPGAGAEVSGNSGRRNTRDFTPSEATQRP
jgi:EmrB/QacA subfamily drug resistance transporter